MGLISAYRFYKDRSSNIKTRIEKFGFRFYFKNFWKILAFRTMNCL